MATAGSVIDVTELTRGAARAMLETGSNLLPTVQSTRAGTERVLESIPEGIEKLLKGEFEFSDITEGFTKLGNDFVTKFNNAIDNFDFNQVLNTAGKEVSPSNDLVNAINRLTEKFELDVPIPNRTTVTPGGTTPAVFEVKPIVQTTNVKFEQLSLNVNGTIRLEGDGQSSEMMASQLLSNNGQYRGQLERIIQDTVNNMKQPVYTALPSTA